MSSVKVRDYKASDYAGVAKNMAAEDMLDPTWDSTSNFNSMVKLEPSNILVAELDGKVVGSVVIAPYGTDAAYIFRLVVAKGMRGKGVASQILAAADNMLKSRGFKEVALWVDAEKPGLHEFYTKRGYRMGKHTYRVMWKPLKQ